MVARLEQRAQVVRRRRLAEGFGPRDTEKVAAFMEVEAQTARLAVLKDQDKLVEVELQAARDWAIESERRRRERAHEGDGSDDMGYADGKDSDDNSGSGSDDGSDDDDLSAMRARGEDGESDDDDEGGDDAKGREEAKKAAAAKRKQKKEKAREERGAGSKKRQRTEKFTGDEDVVGDLTFSDSD